MIPAILFYNIHIFLYVNFHLDKDSTKKEVKTTPPVVEKSKESSKESSQVTSEPAKERRGSTSAIHASFPSYPSHTTDSVRLKCREMLCAAITGDGVAVDGNTFKYHKQTIYFRSKIFTC